MTSDWHTCLLVTAHPDDECMFFGPALEILRLSGTRVHLLCLSTGNADGLGLVRTRELHDSCKILDVAEVQVVDDENLQDGQVWQISDVARHVSRAVARWKPDTILTFDAGGVSGHSNHGACFGGVLESRKEMRDRPSLMVLKTVPLWRKYFRWLDSSFPLRLTQEQRLCCSRRPGRAIRAMRSHRSQMAWFRWIWLLLSSYMHRNILERLA